MDFLQPDLSTYLFVSSALFAIGVLGVLTRKNAIVIFMSVELMLNAVNLALVTFSRFQNNASGSMFVFFVMCVAAAEAVVGLAILISLYRNKESLDVNEFNLFKW